MSVYLTWSNEHRCDPKPTADEAAGIAWWNGLSEADRAAWLKGAGSAVPAEAWAAFKQEGPWVYPPVTEVEP